MDKNTESGGTPSESPKSAKRSGISKKVTEKSSKDKSHVGMGLRNAVPKSGGGTTTTTATCTQGPRGKPHTVSRPPDTLNTASTGTVRVADAGTIENKMDRLERMMLTQSRQNAEFQKSIMTAMQQEDLAQDNNDYANDEWDLDSWLNTDDGEGEEEVDTAIDHGDIDDKIAGVDDGQPKGFAVRFCQKVDVGAPIDGQTAESLKCLLHTKIEDSKLSETCETYPCPSNAKELIVPKVNPTIWESVSTKSRSRDLKLQRVQRPLIKGITALVATGKGDDKYVNTEGMQDALALLANANYELLSLRKEMLKQDINPKYAHLCRPTVKPTEFLFGDIGKHVKEFDEQYKASAGICNTRLGARFTPYPRRGGRGVRMAARPGGGRMRFNHFLGANSYSEQHVRRRGNGRPQSLRRPENNRSFNRPQNTQQPQQRQK